MDAMRKAVKCDGSELPTLFKFIMAQGAFFKKNFGLHYYAKAMNIRRRLRKAYNEVLKDCDVLLMPTVCITAPTLPTDGPKDDVIGNIVFYVYYCWLEEKNRLLRHYQKLYHIATK